MAKQIETQFRHAAAALQRGDARTAKREFLKLTKRAPQSPGAWYNLGLSCQFLDQHQRAVSAYKKAVALDPRWVDAWINLGLSHKHLGDGDAARTSADKALALDPHHPRAFNLLGTLEAERGNRETALEYFQRCLEAQPDNTDASINLANLYLDMGNVEEADRVVSSLPGHLAGDKRVRLIKVRILTEQRAFDQAESILKDLRHQQSDADVLRAELALREAIPVYFGAAEVGERLVRLAPEDADARNSLGNAYLQLNRVRKAIDHYEKAIELNPDNAGFYNNLGLAYASFGDRQTAEQHYRHALALDPRHSEVYLNVAAMKRYTSLSDPDIKAAETLWRQLEEGDHRRIQLAFALGKMYDDCGAKDEAFSIYRIGNELKFQEPHIDLDRYFNHMEHIASFFKDPPPVEAELIDSPQPIFILGMPRSGTTLVEQILSRHPQVVSCGELPFVEYAVLNLEKGTHAPRTYPDDFLSIGRDEFTRQARDYLDSTDRLHELNQPFFTDKMPYNFIHIWLIKALFPGAPILHCKRHPLDVILSNYFQWYTSEVSFAYNLKTLADYTVRYYRLMKRWKQLFGDRIVDVNYEILVHDTEHQIRRLVHAAGLPWSDACLDPKMSTNSVRTASIWQIRRSVYSDSLERWKQYEHHLGDAIQVLVNEGILDGESRQVLPEYT